ncbi:MAG: metal ABC transporter ATP-binding protein [Candidatus Aminicenantes bacterium]|nr:MAG: metal ABC transporter ATP-binding protein [Candidatus Aminicenantes bacterium]
MDSSANKPNELITVQDISFRYGYTDVLTGVTFSINSGDFLAVIGPNGSGKTTLVKIILGLLRPAQGEIRIIGKPIEEFTDWQKLGYVPQKATHIDPFFPVSAKEVVHMGLISGRRLPGLTRKEEELSIQKALSHVGMEPFKNRRIGSLSGGQQQRIFIARAIVNQPEILFLDEPTTGVDAETQGHFYDMLDNLNKRERITIVLITHDFGVVNRHVTQVACLNQKLVYHGSHAEFCRSEAFKEILADGHHMISHRH